MLTILKIRLLVKFSKVQAYDFIEVLDLCTYNNGEHGKGENMNQSKISGEFPFFFLIKTLLFQYIITGVLLALLAFLLYKTGLGEKTVSIAIIVIYVAATLFGGWMVGKRMGNRRFMWGLLMGCGYFLLLTICSLIMGGENIQVGNSFWTTLMICACSGMLGGMIS